MSDNRENRGAEHNAELPIESKVVQKKNSLSKKIAGALLSEDYQMIFNSIYQEIIDPLFRRILVESFRAFVYRKTNGASVSEGNTAYDSFYDKNGGVIGSENRLKPDFGTIQFKTQDSAERVLNIMRSYIKKHGFVKVSDYYKIAGQKPEYSYMSYGWTNLDSASTYQIKINGEIGWCIRFPEPMFIETN